MKPKYSFRDKYGRLWIACSECVRGGNGIEPNPENLCSVGFDVKRGGSLGCFNGKLLPVYSEPK